MPASSWQVPLSFQQPLGGDGRCIISAPPAKLHQPPSGLTHPRYRFSVLRTREGSCHEHDHTLVVWCMSFFQVPQAPASRS